MTAQHDSYLQTIAEFRFPKYTLAFTLIVCLLPLLQYFDSSISFASPIHLFDIEKLNNTNFSYIRIQDELYFSLIGAFHHSLLEWSAVVLAFLGAFIAFSHYSVSKEYTAPVIGIALLLSGTMDMFHILTASRLIDTVTENTDVTAFTWAAARSFNAIYLFIGGVLLLLRKNEAYKIQTVHLIIIGILFFILTFLSIKWMMFSERLPQTAFPNDIVSRPYDVLPLVFFIFCLPVFYRIYKQSPSILTLTLLISILPDIFSQLYAAFGSTELFDHYFNSAHFLKMVGYALPCYGYLLDYRQKFLQKQLQEDILVNINRQFEITDARYRLINHLLPVGYMLVDTNGKICEVNSYSCQLFGYTEDELLSMNVDQLVPMANRPEHHILRHGFSSEMSQRKMAENAKSLSGQHKNGTLIPVEIGLAPITFDLQFFTAVTLLDVKDRRDAMEQLENKNQQLDMSVEKLRQTNEQLERFAFICSHDLQEPIRMVLSFSQLLEKKEADKLDPKSLTYLKYITDGALNAREMVSDILDFCRLDQHNTEAYTLINLNNLCAQVRGTLQVTLEERNASFVWDDNLPIIKGVSSQVHQLMMNLVTNGIKFNLSKRPEVKVSCIDNGNFWQITVTDNGIGIDMRYVHKLFQIFARLHSKTIFPGTGIGLAMCKKIAVLHGATILIESELEKGSRFILQWPKALNSILG